jgi:hypothetical protein
MLFCALCAYVLRKHAAPIGVDLGPAATIERLIDVLRESCAIRRTPA